MKKLILAVIIPILSVWLPLGSAQDVFASSAECGASSASVSLTVPNGGQKLEHGSIYQVNWSVGGYLQTRISLSLDGGETFPITVAESANSPVYDWTVNDWNTESARIRLEAVDACGQVVATDVSDADFTIYGTQTYSLPVEESEEVAEEEGIEVVLSTPISGSEVSGTVLMQATAGSSVDSLTFEVVPADGGTVITVNAASDGQGRTWTGFLDSTVLINGDYLLTSVASLGGETVGRSSIAEVTVDNLILPEISVSLTDPKSGSVFGDFMQMTAVTDLEADALDFIVKPKAANSSSVSAVTYGLTGSNRLLWTSSFDTRKYPDGEYLVKAKAYLFGTIVGESAETAVFFDNPEVGTVGVTVSVPVSGAEVTGQIALVARTSVAAGALDFVITADSSAGQDDEPTIIKATPDLEKKKWTALWASYDLDNGSYGLKAKAYVNGSLAGESQMQSLSVSNSLVLVGIDLLSPDHGSSIYGTLTVSAETDEPVEKVDFLVMPDDASLDATATVLPAVPAPGNLRWSAVWDTVPELDGLFRVWARSWYMGRVVGESSASEVRLNNRQSGEGISGRLNLAESLAPGTDPNRSGEYGRLEAIAATPTINLNLDLVLQEGTEYLLPPGTLFKSPESAAVYYYGRNGKRYVFPDSGTFRTWYGNFDNVMTVGAATVAAIPLGGNVTYRPGVRMVKITSDPKVYAVARGGILRWVRSEVVARRLYGTDWNRMIDDVSDAFFFNYAIGDPIEE